MQMLVGFVFSSTKGIIPAIFLLHMPLILAFERIHVKRWRILLVTLLRRLLGIVLSLQEALHGVLPGIAVEVSKRDLVLLVHLVILFFLLALLICLVC
jgi:hypothetical protein